MPEEETPPPAPKPETSDPPEPPVIDPGEIGTTKAYRGILLGDEPIGVIDPGEIGTVRATKSNQSGRLKQTDKEIKGK
jgi:hypothetical protein